MGADSGMAVNDLVQRGEQFRDAYQKRDIDRLMDMFADDAELTWAVGTFHGKAAIRRVFEWDFGLSPAVNVRDAGVGMIATDHTVVFERVVEATAEGIPYEEPAVTIYEMTDTGQICRMRSYYDKLSILNQVASRYPGVRGRLLRAMTGFLVRLGSQGLEQPPK